MVVFLYVKNISVLIKTNTHTKKAVIAGKEKVEQNQEIELRSNISLVLS